MGRIENLMSRTISFVRFPMIFIIIYLHVVIGAWQNGLIVDANLYDTGYATFRMVLCEGFCRLFTPIFFFISGCLFFYNNEFSKAVYIGKIKKRIKSLFVPYLFWNLIVILFYLLSPLLFPSMVSGTKKPVLDYSFMDWLLCFIDSDGGYPINLPLWFIRNLMCMIIATPIIYFLIRKLKFVIVAVLGILWIVYGTPSNVIKSVFFFVLGCYAGIEKFDFTRLIEKKKLKYTVYASYIILMTITLILMSNKIQYTQYLHNLAITFGSLAVLLFVATKIKNNSFKPNRFLEQNAYFLYLFHAVPLLFLCKISVKCLHPESTLALISLHLVLPVVMAAISIAFHSIGMKYMPKFMSWIGG